MGEEETKALKNPDISTLFIDRELHRQVRIRAAETRKTIRQVVEAALRLYLNGGPPNPTGK